MISLEDRLKQVKNPVELLRSAPAVRADFQYPIEWGGWYDEQWAWRNTAILFDQSLHMHDFVFTGPDVKRLFTHTGINSFADFGRGMAKQFVAVNPDGYFIGDGILFAFEDDEYHLVVGPTHMGAWLEYQAEIGGYDVEMTVDGRSRDIRDRKLYRYQMTGPAVQDVLEKAQGSPLDPIKFFHMGELKIAGRTVRALNHSMAGGRGRMQGLELMGPVEDADLVVNAIVEAGKEFGLRRGGARAYGSSIAESGWFARPLPAIYTGEKMKPFRERFPAASAERLDSLNGSFTTDDIEDYYWTPWDLGYGYLVKFDHDFIGREALEASKDKPHRRKVFIEWDNEDVSRIITDSLFKTEDRPRELDVPGSMEAVHLDRVMIGDRLVGVSYYTGYTVSNGSWVSLGLIDEADAEDGAEVIVVWGEDDGGAGKPLTQPHVQTEVRGTVRLKVPAVTRGDAQS
ncbi:aminomethyl transferase family protein [Microbacterium sp. NPDC058062]|uniref:aminomethyl transferase family protein n=1 Tax=Microbacterium sp. NPDC058062 TaxID=3346320 RepID=UPI0036D966FB